MPFRGKMSNPVFLHLLRYPSVGTTELHNPFRLHELRQVLERSPLPLLDRRQSPQHSGVQPSAERWRFLRRSKPEQGLLYARDSWAGPKACVMIAHIIIPSFARREFKSQLDDTRFTFLKSNTFTKVSLSEKLYLHTNQFDPHISTKLRYMPLNKRITINIKLAGSPNDSGALKFWISDLV